MFNKTHEVVVERDDDKQRRLLALGGILLDCRGVCVPSCGYMGSQYFRLESQQVDAYHKMSRVDEYEIEASIQSPVWGKLSLKYERSPTDKGAEWKRTTWYDSDDIGWTKTTVTARGEELSLPREDGNDGYPQFSYFLEDTKRYYCGTIFAFDPVEWKFLPRPRHSSTRVDEPGLKCVYHRGEIVGFDYKLSREYTNEDVWEWEGTSPSSRGPRRLSSPTTCLEKKKRLYD